MSRFDEEPDGDPHGECAAEIHRLEALNATLLETIEAMRIQNQILNDKFYKIHDEIKSIMSQPIVAWADDKAIGGNIGNVCSTAAKQYWEKSNWVDSSIAAKHTHPLIAYPKRGAS